MKIKDKARELIKAAVLGTAKGLSAAAQINPILAILLTFLESILEKFFDYDKEERDKSADALKSLGKTEIKKLIDKQDKRLEKYSGMLADLTEEFCTSIKEIKEQDSINLHFIKEELLAIIIKRLDENQAALSREIQDLKKILSEALAYIKKDPSECLVIPASSQLAAEETETTLDLLSYSRQWIPLIGRDGEMKDLVDFADATDTFSWWGVQGPGGCGKSRLALEWILKLKEKGWKAGFIRKDNARDDLNGFLTANDWAPLRDTAIVVDYGHEINDFLPGFIKDVANRLQGKECTKLKLLVLDRASSGESWWLTMMDHSSAEAKRAIEHTCFKTKPIKDKYGTIEKLEPILINIEIINSADDQVRIIHISIRKFKKDDYFQVPSAEKLLPLTGHFAKGRPLYLIMLGISIAQRGMDSVKDLSREEILDDCIKHEVDIWRKLFGKEYIDQAVSDIGFITLCNGLPSSALDELPASPSGQGNRDRDYRVKLKNILYIKNREKEDEQEFINPLVPDILGEWFLLTGGVGEGKEPYFKPASWIERCLELAPGGLGQTILRSFQDFDQLDVISKWLDIAFKKISEDYEGKMFYEFIVYISEFIINIRIRRNKLDNNDWIKKYKNLACINVSSAKIITNMIISLYYLYNSEQDWNEYEEWKILVNNIISNPLFSTNREINLNIIKSAVNVINFLGNLKKDEEIKKWVDLITEIMTKIQFKNDKDFALQELHAIGNLIKVNGSLGLTRDFDEYSMRIKKIKNNPSFIYNKEIVIAISKVIFNAITTYGSQNMFEELESWKIMLDEISENAECKNILEVTLFEMKAANNSIGFYGSQKKWEELENWGDKIRRIRSDSMFKDNLEVAKAEANASYNAASEYAKANKLDKLEEWADRIKIIRNNHLFEKDIEIARAQAKIATNAIKAYGDKNDFDSMEKWGQKISNIRNDSTFTDDLVIAFSEAKASSNEIVYYCKNNDLQKAEISYKRILSLRSIPIFADNVEIAREECKSVYNIITAYTLKNNIKESSILLERVIILYKNFPFDLEIIKGCAEAIVRHFLKVPNNSLGELLIDIADHVPWIKFPSIQNIPLGISIPNLISEIRIISPDLDRTSKNLKKQMEEVLELLKLYPDYSVMPIVPSRNLWKKRKFLDNWGKNLWGEIIKAGNIEWLREALDDPWNSPEDREILKKLLKEHTDSKE